MGQIIKTILEKIAAFFHIFDASYFITGMCGFLFTVLILFMNGIIAKTDLVWILSNMKLTTFLLFSVVIYSCGVTLYLYGRYFRIVLYENFIHPFLRFSIWEFWNIPRENFKIGTFKNEFDLKIHQAIIHYNLVEDFEEFHKSQIEKWRTPNNIQYSLNQSRYKKRIFYKYYIYCWSKMRESKSDSYDHLNRKWVSIAKMDGFSAICSLLGVGLTFNIIDSQGGYTLFFSIVSLAIFQFLFIRESRETYLFEMEDLMSTHSYLLSKK